MSDWTDAAITDALEITVITPLIPSVTIAVDLPEVCAGETVTFTATPVNGGISPGYQWKVNGTNAGANLPVYSFVPLNGDQVMCVVTSGIPCVANNPASSNSITMVVNPNLPAGITIVASPNPFCLGSAVTLTASPSNGGFAPIYQWQVNGINTGANSSTFTYNPANNDLVRCIMTSGLTCVTGSPASSANVIMNGLSVPMVSFASCSDTVTTLGAKPFKLRGGLPLGGSYSGPGVNPVTGIFTPSAAGIGIKSITYTYLNVSSCSDFKTRTIRVHADPAFTCGGNFADIRDGRSYPTVLIGTQCWMKENLDFGFRISDLVPQTDNCIPEFYKNPNSGISNPKSVYQWDELMQYQTTEGSQGLCPPGWHVPTETEWTTLVDYYLGNGSAGRPLQDTFLNEFNALRHGVFYLNSSWSFTDFATIFWSSTSSGPSTAISHGMNLYDFSVSLYPGSRANAFSVRCIHD
jgi:uncharacterized protein (TIGR02145 family)